MISTAVVSGLAGFWVWVVFNDKDGVFGLVKKTAERTRWTAKWLACPWCSGAWFSIAASVSVFHPQSTAAVVTALAAAGIAGLLGSYIGGE